MKLVNSIWSLVRVILLALILAPASPGLAQTAPPSITGCFPPTVGGEGGSDDCSLTHRPPSPLRQDIHVTDCSFLPGQSSFRETRYKLMLCSVLNGSKEPVESFRYGVRYFSSPSNLLLAEGGFKETNRFSTANIDGGLRPGEERLINFLGPALPDQIDARPIKVVVEVIGVYVPGSRMLR